MNKTKPDAQVETMAHVITTAAYLELLEYLTPDGLQFVRRHLSQAQTRRAFRRVTGGIEEHRKGVEIVDQMIATRRLVTELEGLTT